MREIKFRAWDKSLEEMRYSINIPSDYTERNGSLDLINMFQALNQRYVFMQYTGLIDKNGKEIYEGDIVQCYGGAYLNGIYEYDYVTEVRDIRDLNGIIHSENVEILGNRYENPELLEEDEE